MATRLIEIKITGDSHYEYIGEELAERINEMMMSTNPIERDKAIILYSIAYADDEEYYDTYRGAAMEQLKQLMTVISQKERVELYKFLNTVFQCRM